MQFAVAGIQDYGERDIGQSAVHSFPMVATTAAALPEVKNCEYGSCAGKKHRQHLLGVICFANHLKHNCM